MRQRARWLNALLFEGDGGGLGLADPNWQVPVTVGLAQQQHRLVLRLLYANADDTNFTHLCLPSAHAAVVVPLALGPATFPSRPPKTKPSNEV
ncbi:hypothetical protein MHEI_42710 [Mycobacterium heidelbergense]|nr:hypothetical protein MHEI_42710 [Mycobacterium heidelbergense]